MAEFLYKTKFIQHILKNRRKRRAEFIMSKVNTALDMSILDVGCGPSGRSFEDYVHKDFKITGIDLLDEKKVKMARSNFTYYKQDAQDLNIFRDKEFDLTVSFGMMEHICNHTILRKMASEIERVSKQWVIVVPWKYAFIEPHFRLPFFQLLPYSLKVFLTKVFNLHNLREAVKKDYDYIKNHYQWLSNRQWKEIFKASKTYISPGLDTIALVEDCDLALSEEPS